MILLPEVEAELSEAMLWYEARRPGLGHELLGAVHRTLAQVQEAPERFGQWVEDQRYRRAVVRETESCLRPSRRGRRAGA